MKKSKYILNGSMLLCVKIRDKEPCNYITWKSEVKPKFFGLISGKIEGFYSCLFLEDGSYYTTEELQSGKYNGIKFIVEDKIVYYKPNVKLIFQGGYETNMEFPTYEEALSWGKSQATKATDIKLQIEIV